MDNQNEIKLINVDIITDDLSQDACSVVRAFHFLRRQDFFKEIEKPDYIVWMDCGKHFRNQYVAGYLLEDLAKKHKIRGNFYSKHHNILLISFNLYLFFKSI